MTQRSPIAVEAGRDLAAISEGRWTITELTQAPMLVLGNDDHIIAIIPLREQPRARRDAEFLMKAPSRVQSLAAENAELRDTLNRTQRALERLRHDVARAAGVLGEGPGQTDLCHGAPGVP
jgi:hypothetical protein